jgi:hypothetical protein
MDSKSETENYKLANPEAVDSVVENGIKGTANGNIFQASLHYSVAMDKNGNIRPTVTQRRSARPDCSTCFILLHHVLAFNLCC